MGLKGKMINQIEIKCGGDVFHEIFRHKPHDIANIISTDKIHGIELHEGDWGHVGSVICWTFTHDGKKKIAKERIVAIDEEKKSITFKIIGGDLLEYYKTLIVTAHVDTHGENNLVTWTFEYEKLNEDVPYPTTLMDVCLQVTKDIEKHHL